MKSSTPSNGAVGVQVMPQRVYLNAFPKAGTHLAELFVRLTAAPLEGHHWLGSFSENAWSDSWVDLSRFRAKLDEWPSGAYLKGHCGYSPDIAEWLWNAGICSIFVYRNLRDVVISQAHHILNDRKEADGKDTLKHPGKALYRALGSFDSIVIACIRGIKGYPGIVDRWRLYRPWLDEKWVLPLRFEDMRQKPRETASLVIRYVTGQTAGFYGHKVTIDKLGHDSMVNAALALVEQHKGATFRRGKANGWRDEWTPAIEDAWQRAGGPEANEELGYASA